MFWDTIDLFTDSPQASQTKKYRRKSNYYEDKSQRIENLLRTCKTMLEQTQNTYKLGSHSISTSMENVMCYRYYEEKTYLFEQTNNKLDRFNEKIQILNRELTKAQTLHQKYYNLAIRGED